MFPRLSIFAVDGEWTTLLLREGPVEILLSDAPEELDYPEPYVERTLLQLRDTGLLDDELKATEEGQRVREALRELLGRGGEEAEDRDKIDELRARAEEGVSVIERGRILRRLSGMERAADEEERSRIEEVRELLGA